MKKNRKNAGFTMVELMVVVAILTILMGVAFVNVIAYQRKLKAKEADSAAKELFIAAQNHLTAADALGQLEGYKASPAETAVEKSDGSDYYVVYPGSYTMRDVMLPFGSIDDTVRTGGSYIIHYNLKLATVLDVFYSDASDSRFGADLSKADFSALSGNYAGDAKKKERRNATVSDKTRRVIGWYGGANVGSYSDYLAEPTIKVTNGDILKVEVSALKAKTGESLENHGGRSLSLIITGVSSGAMKEIKLFQGDESLPGSITDGTIRTTLASNNNYQIILDDITNNVCQFASVMSAESVLDENNIPKIPKELGAHSGTFLPGEDLSIRAVAFDNQRLSNIAESGTVRVNSLFGSLTKGGPDTTDPTKTIPDTVTISSFRHLENLDSTISRLDWGALATVGTEKAIASADRIGAKQDTDLNWTEFLTNTQAALDYPYQPVIPRKTDAAGTNATIPVIYHGQSHSIRNLSVSATNANAGLFDTLPSGSSVSNLDLVNFKVAAHGSYKEMVNGREEQVNARSGALAGVANADLTNVKVYNDINGLTDDVGSPLTDDSSFSITGSGDVGGLVGQFTGSADGCAAAVYVNSTDGSAGGLFGTASATDANIKNSYSGGHTSGGKYNEVKKKNSPSGGKTSVTFEVQAATTGKPLMNVTGTTAGGLIGTLSSGTVEDCYSTCSVNGTVKAGGFVGSTGGTINRSYCTGLVALNNLACTRTRAESGADPQLVGLFAGEKTDGTIDSASHYMEIVNYIDPNAFKEDNTKEVIPAVGKGGGIVTAFDASADAYNNFIDHTTVPTVPAVPYDKALLTKAETIEDVPQYSLKPVRYTCTIGSDPYTVAQHIGDWPIYETYVVNN